MLAETLAWLVNIPSPTGQETAICDAIARRMRSTYPPDQIRRIGDSLVVGSPGPGPLILLVGHIDTVPPQGQGPARIEEGVMFGLGTSDMKSGVAVMIHLLEEDAVRNGPYEVVGVFYHGEEGTFADNGLEPVLQETKWLSEAAFAVVVEPTDLELQLGCQGTANATVGFRGKAAHSARPWLGENAITKAGAWLESLHHRQPVEHVLAGLSFFEVFSVTRAAAGVANNVIPADFDLHLNYRFPPHLTLDQAQERMIEVAEPADNLEIHEVVPGAPIPEGNPYLDLLKQVTQAPVTPKQAWTDVARLSQHGIAAVNYGPGEVAQAHQVTESVPINNLDQAYQALLRFLTE